MTVLCICESFVFYNNTLINYHLKKHCLSSITVTPDGSHLQGITDGAGSQIIFGGIKTDVQQ